jgi:choline dehydrogenase-like flavoprotein
VAASPLSAARLRTLAALVARLAPPPVRDTLTDEVAARIGRLPPRAQRDVGHALTLLGAPFASAIAGSGLKAFHVLAPAAQDAILLRWMGSPLPAVRLAITALRRLVLSCAVAPRAAQDALGVVASASGALPRTAWDGPLPGVDSTMEPVARGDARPVVRPLPAGRVLDATTLVGVPLRCDVLVIGSGAGGAIAAARLAAAGRDVLIVETGELLSVADRDADDAAMMERAYADGGTRSTDDLRIPLLQGSAVGGGTLVNWMIVLRTPEHVLDEWQREFGLADCDARTFGERFARIEQELRARGVPDDAHSRHNQQLLAGARALGWRHDRARINADRCLRCGACGLGCPHGAKQDALEGHLRTAMAHGARLLPRARADRVQVVGRATAGSRTPPDKLVTLTLRAADGMPLGTTEVRTPLVCVAAGAIETPALLQRSGLGGDRVGDFLRLHPTTVVLGLHDEPVHADAGIPLSALVDEFAAVDPDGYGYWIECPPLQPSLAALAIPVFGAQAAEWLSHFPRLSPFIALVRDGADRAHSSGRVRARRDGSVSIRYELAPRDREHLRQATLAAARLQFAAGASEVRTTHDDPCVVMGDMFLDSIAARSFDQRDMLIASAHVNGTCRMTNDPRTGGCDPSGQRWKAPGVYVVDGSLLPTAPGVNPQLSIMALAEHVVEGILAAH